jgi:phosphorylase/glycogen(starch) synthase
MRKHLFEVSWEVCNKVGGIHTVITSKLAAAGAAYGEHYTLLGPLVDNADQVVASDDPVTAAMSRALEARGIPHRIGRWRGFEQARVLLVGFRDRFDLDKLLYSYWQQFGVDSIAGGWDYIEPVLFSTACGQAIEAIFQETITEPGRVVAHFHEWMCGGGLLHVKKAVPEIGTVFTTHATVLGRSMAGAGRDIYARDARIDPAEEARARGVSAKHSLEVACAREADCFTTVSEVTADEAARMLGIRPDLVVCNGFDLDAAGELAQIRARGREARARLLGLAGNFLGRELHDETRLWISSGRYEFHNKGYDVFLEALARLDRHLREEPATPPVVAWFQVASGNAGLDEDVRQRVLEGAPQLLGGSRLATHRLHDETHDPVVGTCLRLGLRNEPDNRVLVLLTSAYLDGRDGLLDMPYYDALAAADLGVFPSFYEPWGYTPLEAVALGVPAITSDLAGFGRWADGLKGGTGHAVSVIARADRGDEAVIGDLLAVLEDHARLDERALDPIRQRARQIASRATWRSFFGGYDRAYSMAADRAMQRLDSLDTSAFSDDLFISFKGAGGPGPHYRSFTVITTLPEEISGLNEIAHNLWWSWHPEAEELFEDLDPALWERTRHNPVALLAAVSESALAERAADAAFVKRYKRVLGDLRAYLADDGFDLEADPALRPEGPVAYFSMEFCLHESLPIYSGGLGVLSGDHLKSASDLGIPLVAVGLLYRQGYFEQHLDADGDQVEQYPFLDTSKLPLRLLTGADGKEIRIAVELAGRPVQARAFEVGVGRVRLFLLDPDVDENTPRDRQIAWRLYGGDRRTRLEQELLLGIGGVRLLEDELHLRPGVYHLNEGHCGFLVFERIRRLMRDRGLSFPEAREAAKASSVFTTHTPVPAGNETFEPGLVREYFGRLAEELGIDCETVLEMGRSRSEDGGEPFSMTVLGLKISSRANGVSKLHGAVCREMWRDVWKDVAVEEVPIGSITNGVHLTSWLGRPMRRLLGQYLDLRWDRNHDDPDIWAQVDEVPDDRLWTEHLTQKRRLLAEVERRVVEDYARRGEDPQLIRETVRRLEPETLTLGFARRFASYKRAHLLLRDPQRLARLLSDPERPMRLLVAGKAHPADGVGKDLIRKVVEAARTPELRGRIIYLENYNMALGRLMTQGVDVWLNTPIRPHEASGTSGMKVVPNGGLNCSIRDGWWDEACADDRGFTIDSGTSYKNREHQDEADAHSLFDLLERRVVPLYYERDEGGVPAGWVAMMKRGLATMAPVFNTMRMLKEYYGTMYLPAARRGAALGDDDFAGIRRLTAWKRRIAARFSTVQIEEVFIKGITGETLPSDAVLELEMFVRLGRLQPAELRAELVIGTGDAEGFAGSPQVIPFGEPRPVNGTGLVRLQLSHRVAGSGSYRWAARIVPVHPLLDSTQETGLAQWW